ncbi:MAG TPA: extracellular solute-binding protein [Clostridia bacterium]|nr:extracellular solute-binding protein [Clostridia bacterium]
MKKAPSFIYCLLVTALLLTGLSGCGKGSGAGAMASGETTSSAGNAVRTIRVATTFTGDDPYKTVWQEVLKDFAVKHPDINVVDEATSAGGDAFKIKINTDFASGNEPDVTYGFNGALGKPLIDSGKVITWEEELKADPAWAGSFKPDMLETCKYEGKLYALPFLGFFEGMWVNRDIFEKYGLGVPKTYDDILKAIPILRSHDITPIACSFSDEPHYIIETFILAVGGSQGHSNLFDPSWSQALEFIKKLYEENAFTKDALTIKQGKCAELFADKKAAMFISGSWSRGYIKDHENTIVIPLPTVPNGKADPTDIVGGAGTGWYLAGVLNEQKDGAGMTFVKYMTRPEVVAKFADVAGVPLIDCEVKAKTPLDQSCLDLMNNAASINGAVGDVLGQEVFGAIWHGLSPIVTGKASAQQVIDNAKQLYYR